MQCNSDAPLAVNQDLSRKGMERFGALTPTCGSMRGVRAAPKVAQRLTLVQKLQRFEFSRHGGEMLACAPTGQEFTDGNS